jgi:hypothetical protein
MKDKDIAFILLLIPICLLIFIGLFPQYSSMYATGVSDTHREAFEHGLMTKEITADDKVIYRWTETHKIGY